MSLKKLFFLFHDVNEKEVGGLYERIIKLIAKKTFRAIILP